MLCFMVRDGETALVYKLGVDIPAHTREKHLLCSDQCTDISMAASRVLHGTASVADICAVVLFMPRMLNSSGFSRWMSFRALNKLMDVTHTEPDLRGLYDLLQDINDGEPVIEAQMPFDSATEKHPDAIRSVFHRSNKACPTQELDYRKVGVYFSDIGKTVFIGPVFTFCPDGDPPFERTFFCVQQSFQAATASSSIMGKDALYCHGPFLSGPELVFLARQRLTCSEPSFNDLRFILSRTLSGCYRFNTLEHAEKAFSALHATSVLCGNQLATLTALRPDHDYKQEPLRLKVYNSNPPSWIGTAMALPGALIPK